MPIKNLVFPTAFKSLTFKRTMQKALKDLGKLTISLVINHRAMVSKSQKKLSHSHLICPQHCHKAPIRSA
jgi:hypothetical protein